MRQLNMQWGGGHRFFWACSPDVPNVIPRVFPIGTESCRCRIIEGRFCYTECFGFLETRTYVKHQLVFEDGQDACWEMCVRPDWIWPLMYAKQCCGFPCTQGEPLEGREATAPWIIIEIREVQWREETPPDGGIVTPKDIQFPCTRKVPYNHQSSVPLLRRATFHQFCTAVISQCTLRAPYNHESYSLLRGGTRDFSDLACSVDVLYAHSKALRGSHS